MSKTIIMGESLGAEQESIEKSDIIFKSGSELPCLIKIEERNYFGGEMNDELTPDYDIDIFQQDVKKDCSESPESNLTNVAGECLVNKLLIYLWGYHKNIVKLTVWLLKNRCMNVRPLFPPPSKYVCSLL